jgi:hypothetical protein
MYRYIAFFLCLISLVNLTACATSAPPASVCPKIKTYSPQEQLNQAAAEDLLPKNSPLAEPLLEWSSLRNQLKACNGA